MPVIRGTPVRIAQGLRILDGSGQSCRPFHPSEDAALMQRHNDGEGAGFPRLCKDRAINIAR